MPGKRPTPLAEELLFEVNLPTSQVASCRGPTLLGRVQAQTPPTTKKPTAAAAAETPTGLAFSRLATPITSTASSAPFRFPFTPISTPSPGARYGVLQSLRLAGALLTPSSGGAAPPTPAGALATVPSPVVEELAGPVACGWGSAGGLAGDVVGRPACVAPAGSVDGEADDGDDSCSEAEELGGSPGGPLVSAGPLPPPGALHPSQGSAGHVSGACKRCCFFPRGRCMNGYDCQFCHYEHEKPKRKHRSRREVGRSAGTSAPSGGLVLLEQPMFRPMIQVQNGLCCLVQPAPMVVLQQWPAPQHLYAP